MAVSGQRSLLKDPNQWPTWQAPNNVSTGQGRQGLVQCAMRKTLAYARVLYITQTRAKTSSWSCSKMRLNILVYVLFGIHSTFESPWERLNNTIRQSYTQLPPDAIAQHQPPRLLFLFVGARCRGALCSEHLRPIVLEATASCVRNRKRERKRRNSAEDCVKRMVKMSDTTHMCKSAGWAAVSVGHRMHTKRVALPINQSVNLVRPHTACHRVIPDNR